MSTTPVSQSYPPGRTRNTRKSPLDSAIMAAEKAVIRMTRRKARSFTRIERLKARIAVTAANATQFDGLIAQLAANVQALKTMASGAKV